AAEGFEPQMSERHLRGALSTELVDTSVDRLPVGRVEVLPHHRVPQHRRRPGDELELANRRERVELTYGRRNLTSRGESAAYTLDSIRHVGPHIRLDREPPLGGRRVDGRPVGA